MTVSLGTLEIGLGLITTQYDTGIARAKGQLVSLQRMAARSGVTVKIGVKVDDRPLYQLNDHLKLKRDDLDKTSDHYRRNPIRVFVQDQELVRLNQQLRDLKRVSVDIKVPSRLVVEHRFSGYQDKVEKEIERSTSRLASEIRKSYSRGGIVGAASRLVTGVIALPFKATATVLRDVVRGYFERIGQEFSNTWAVEPSRNAARKITIAIKKIDRYLLGQNQVLETYLSELTRSGSTEKAFNAAFKRTNVNQVIERFKTLQEIATVPASKTKERLRLIQKDPELSKILKQSTEEIQKQYAGQGLSKAEIANLSMQRFLENAQPQTKVVNILNSFLKEISPFLRFVQGMKDYRTSLEAQKIYSERKAGFPKLKEGEDVVSVIGGAQFRGGQGGRKAAMSLEPLAPQKRFIPVENPETDTDLENERPAEKQFKAFISRNLTFLEGEEALNTLINAFRQISSSLDAFTPSTAAAQALANTMLAQEQGRKGNVVSYSLGGVDNIQYARTAQFMGVKDTQALAMAYPFVDITQSTPKNFTASMLTSDPLGFVKLLGIGNKTNQFMGIESTNPYGSANHHQKHLFKNIEFINKFFATINANIPDLSPGKISAIVEAGDKLYELIGSMNQIESVLNTGEFNTDLPFHRFLQGYDGQTTKSNVLDLVLEMMQDNFAIEAFKDVEGAEEFYAKLRNQFDKIASQFKEKFQASGVNLPENLAKDFAGFLKYQEVAKGYNKSMTEFQAGKVSEKPSWWAGNLDPNTVKQRTGKLQTETIPWFRKEGSKFGSYQDALIEMFTLIDKVTKEYVSRGGNLSDETRQNLKFFPTETIPDEINAFLGKSFPTKNLPKEEIVRDLNLQFPEYTALASNLNALQKIDYEAEKQRVTKLFRNRQAAILAYNKLITELTDEIVPSIDKIKAIGTGFPELGMHGSFAFLTDEFVYKTDIDPEGVNKKIATPNELETYKQLQGRLSPLLYKAVPDKAIVTERIQGKTLKEILTRIAQPFKKVQKQLADATLALDKVTKEGNEAEIERLNKEITSLEKTAQKEKTRFNKAATILYKQVGQLNSALQKMGVVHNDLAETNVFFSPQGIRAIDFGGSQVNPTTAQKIEDKKTVIDRMMGNNQYEGLMDKTAVAGAILSGFQSPLPIPEKRTVDPEKLKQTTPGQLIELGSTNPTLLQQYGEKITYPKTKPFSIPPKQEKVTTPKTEKLNPTVFLEQSLTRNTDRAITALNSIEQVLNEIKKGILAKYASPLIDPWQNSTPDPWAKSNAELMRAFVDAINKVSSQKLLPPAPDDFGSSETDRGNSPLEKILEDISIKAQAGLKSALTTRLSTPDSSGEIQLLTGQENISELLNQVLIREVKEAGRILGNALKDASLDVVKFGQIVFTVLKAIERPVMAIPGVGLGKKALQVGGTAAIGAAALHALPMGLDATIVNEMRSILAGAMSAGGREMIQAVATQMTQAFSGLPFGVGQQLTEAVMNLVTELTNGTISVLAQGGAVAGSALMAGEGVKKLLGAATSSVPKLIDKEEQQKIEGKTQKLLKAAKDKAGSLITTEITPYFDEKAFPVSSPIPANIKAINPKYYTVKQLRGLARDQGIDVPASGAGARKEEIWKSLTEKFNPDQLTRLLLTTKASDRTKLGKKELGEFQIATREISADFIATIGSGIKNIRQQINTNKDIQSLKTLFSQLEKIKTGIASIRANPEFDTTNINKSLIGFVTLIDNLLLNAKSQIQSKNILLPASTSNLQAQNIPLPVTETPNPLKRVPQENSPTSPGFVGKLPISDLNLDPERFQYKLVHGKTGSTGSLSGVGKWDDDLAGVVSVWRDPKDGKVYVVNGHNRLNLAKDLNVKDITVRLLNAQSAQEARAKGAMINIAEGRGTAIDAAKFLRDMNLADKESLKKAGIPMRDRVASQGLALAQLPQELFDRVASGDISELRGVQIGGSGLKEFQQRELVKLIENFEKKGKKVTESVVSELIDTLNASTVDTVEQFDLFGSSTTQQTDVLTRAEVQSALRNRIATDKRVFGSLTSDKKAAKLKTAGNQINTEENKAIAEQAEQALRVFDQLKNTASPVSSIINEAITLIKEQGMTAKAATDAVYDKLKQIVPQLAKGGLESGKNLNEGLEKGLKDTSASDIAYQNALKIVDQIDKGLGNASPSWKGEESGENFTKGVAIGIEKGISSFDFRSLANEVVKGFESGLSLGDIEKIIQSYFDVNIPNLKDLAVEAKMMGWEGKPIDGLLEKKLSKFPLSKTFAPVEPPKNDIISYPTPTRLIESNLPSENALASASIRLKQLSNFYAGHKTAFANLQAILTQGIDPTFNQWSLRRDRFNFEKQVFKEPVAYSAINSFSEPIKGNDYYGDAEIMLDIAKIANRSTFTRGDSGAFWGNPSEIITNPLSSFTPDQYNRRPNEILEYLEVQTTGKIDPSNFLGINLGDIEEKYNIYGRKLIEVIASSLSAGVPVFAKNLEAISSMFSSDGKQSGLNYIKGLNIGLQNNNSEKYALDVAIGIIDAINKGLGNASPSWKGKEAGRNLIRGLEIGTKEQAKLYVQFFDKFLQDVNERLQLNQKQDAKFLIYAKREHLESILEDGYQALHPNSNKDRGLRQEVESQMRPDNISSNVNPIYGLWHQNAANKFIGDGVWKGNAFPRTQSETRLAVYNYGGFEPVALEGLFNPDKMFLHPGDSLASFRRGSGQGHYDKTGEYRGGGQGRYHETREYLKDVNIPEFFKKHKIGEPSGDIWTYGVEGQLWDDFLLTGAGAFGWSNQGGDNRRTAKPFENDVIELASQKGVELHDTILANKPNASDFDKMLGNDKMAQERIMPGSLKQNIAEFERLYKAWQSIISGKQKKDVFFELSALLLDEQSKLRTIVKSIGADMSELMLIAGKAGANNFEKGLEIGINSDDAKRIAYQTAIEIVDATNKGLGNASPSKKAIKAMRFFYEGLALGARHIRFGLRLETQFDKEVSDFTFFVGTRSKEARKAILQAVKEMGLDRGERLAVINEIQGSMNTGIFASPRAFQVMKRATVIARPKTTREKILGDWNKKRDNIFNALDNIEKAGVSSGFTDGIVTGLKTAIAQADGFINFLSVGGKALRTLDKELDAATGGMINLRKASLAVIGGFALFKTAEFLLEPLFFAIQDLPFRVQQAVTDSLLAFTELQQIRINLDIAGVNNVDTAIDGLRNRADELGISFRESAKQYAQFQIVTTGSPLQAQGDDIFEGFQSALAVRQTNPQQQTETFRAINQMAARSVLSVEEFTQQLTESGGLYDALIVAARAMGMTTAEFYRQASAGQLLSQDVIPRLAAEYERLSAGGIGASSKTLQAEMNRYQNNIEQLSMSTGEKLGVVAYPALQLLNTLLKGLNDNLGLVATVGASAVISAIGFLGKTVLQFSAATRLGQFLISSYNASLFAMGVTAGQTTTKMQMLSATAKVAGGVLKATIGAMIVPAATIVALQTFYDIFERGDANLKNSLQTLKESRKVLENLGKIEPENKNKNLWNKFYPDMNLSGTEKFFNVLTLGQVYSDKRSNAVFGQLENLKNIRKSAEGLETNLKTYQTVLSDTAGIDKFIDSLQGLRNSLAQVRAERAIAANKEDFAAVARLNEREQELMKQEQETIDRRLGSVGSRITADLQVAEAALAAYEEEYQKSGGTLKHYGATLERFKGIIAGLKAEQQNYLNVLRDQEKEYKKLQYAFNRTLNAQENRNFINARQSLNRQIGNELAFASGQLNEYEFNVKVREESLQTAKEKFASLQTTASETGAKLSSRITEAADKTLSTYFKDDLKRLGVGNFSEAIARNLLAPKVIEDVMSENSGDLESNAALKDILEMAKTYATTRQEILQSEKEIQSINREIITERKRRQIAEKQAANEILIAGQQEKLYSSTPTGKLRSLQPAETRVSLEELYKQLAVEQERLAANVDDPLQIRSNIARIKTNIARTRLTLRDQQNDLVEFYTTTAIEIEATNKQIGLTARTASNQVKTFARDQTLIEISKLYKQLAFEQSKLVGTLKGDPLEVKANIARIQLQIEQAKLSLRDQTTDIEDYYTGLQRQVVDLRVSIEDYQIQSAREVRGFKEAYGDMIRGLQRSLIEAENEFRASQRSLENQRLQVSMLSGRTPGVSSLQKQLDDLILQYRDEIASIQGEADSLRTRPLDIRDQSIQFARQLRDIQEQIYDAERNRLKQLRDFWMQQVQIVRELSQQQLTFKSLNEIWAGILENSKKLLAKSGKIAGGKVPNVALAIGEAPNNSESSEQYRQGTPNNPRTLQRGDYIDYGNGRIYKYDPSPNYDPKTMRYRSPVNADEIRHPSVVQQVGTSGSEEFDRLLMRSGLYKNWEGFTREVLNPNLQPLTPEERANYNAGNVGRYSGVLTGQPQANIPLTPLPTFDYDRARELDTQIRITREKTLQNQKEENLLKLERARRENLDRIAGLIQQTQEARIQAEIGLRDTGDTSTDLMRSSKGYLTFSEKIEQARRNGSREIEKQRESIQSQIRSLDQLTSDFAKNSEETRARLFQDTGNDDAFKALEAENKRNTAILEGYKALDNQLSVYGQIRGEAAAMRMIEDERVAALERYNNLIADGIDAGNRMNPLGTLFSAGEAQKLRIEADFARRRLELQRYAQEGALSPTQLFEMSAALDKMQQANLASAFIEANPAVGAFGDLLRSAFTGGRDTLQQMLNVLTSFLQKIGEMAANQLLMQIFGGSGRASSPVPSGGGGGGLLGGAISLFTGSLGGFSSPIASTPFTGASNFSLGTGFSLFSSGGKIGADAPIEKNVISAFRRERSMSGGRNPRLIVANEDEYVIPANEAKSYLEYKNAPIKNYASGGFVGGTGYSVTTSNNNSSNQSLSITNVSNVTIESRNDMGYSLTQLKERENAQNERTKRRFFG